MLFRNLTLFRFPTSLRAELEAIDQHLPDAALKPVGPFELSSRGFVSPFGAGEDALSHRVGDCILLALGGEDRILPAAVVNRVLAEKVQAIREREGRNPGGRERKRMKDEILTDLIPKAFVRPSRTFGYLDLRRGWLVVDSGSRKVAESFATAIRDALGSFPALPVNAEASPRALLTAWISGETLPDGFQLGDECELRDPVDSGAVVKCRRQDLDSEEVHEHLKAGKQGFHLALVFAERLSFVLGDDMVVRKLKFLEPATAELEKYDRDSVRAELDATFALQSGELGRLIDRLETEFSLSSADEKPAPGRPSLPGSLERLRQLAIEDGASITLEHKGVSVTLHDGTDPLYDLAVDEVRKNARPSIAFIQRRLRIGYNRAARLLEAMEVAGLVSPPATDGTRTVLSSADA